MTMMLAEVLRKYMEVYVDDMLIKSIQEENHVANLEKVFKILYNYQIKLNSKNK